MNRSFAIAVFLGICLALAAPVSAESEVTEIEIPGLSGVSNDARPLRVVRIPAGSFQMGDDAPDNFPGDDVHPGLFDPRFHRPERACRDQSDVATRGRTTSRDVRDGEFQSVRAHFRTSGRVPRA